jgi:small subunit ribosomal protein S16
MLKIRLQRGGKKHKPYYSIVIADSRSPRDGKFIEDIGAYNPSAPKGSAERIKINLEKYNYWLSCGAQPSERVVKLKKALAENNN